MQGFLALKGTLTLETIYVTQLEDIALMRGKWHLKNGTGSDGQPVEMEGNSIEVLRRQPDGRWFYIIDYPFGAD